MRMKKSFKRKNETVSQLNKIREVRKQLQKDLLCYLDERDTRMKDRVCDIVVKNFNKILPPEEG